MDEKVKNKDAEPETEKPKSSSLDNGLADTFPASDPVASTREKSHDPDHNETDHTGPT